MFLADVEVLEVPRWAPSRGQDSIADAREVHDKGSELPSSCRSTATRCVSSACSRPVDGIEAVVVGHDRDRIAHLEIVKRISARRRRLDLGCDTFAIAKCASVAAELSACDRRDRSIPCARSRQ